MIDEAGRQNTDQLLLEADQYDRQRIIVRTAAAERTLNELSSPPASAFKPIGIVRRFGLLVTRSGQRYCPQVPRNAMTANAPIAGRATGTTT